MRIDEEKNVINGGHHYLNILQKIPISKDVKGNY